MEKVLWISMGVLRKRILRSGFNIGQPSVLAAVFPMKLADPFQPAVCFLGLMSLHEYGKFHH